MECTRCGACCVAPDIAALDKPLGLRCPHLGEDNLCTVYDRRPQVCRDYAADWVCQAIEAPTLEERVTRYLALFALTEEAAAVRQSGCGSMRAARATGKEAALPSAGPARSCVERRGTGPGEPLARGEMPGQAGW